MLKQALVVVETSLVVKETAGQVVSAVENMQSVKDSGT
jgi:hypothetical protein